MAFSIIYLIFVSGSLALGLFSANAVHRGFIIAIGLAAASSFLAYSALSEARAGVVVAAIDIVLLALSVYVSLRTSSFWPLWFTGFQAASILSKVAAPWASVEDQRLFEILSSFWVIPCQLSLAIGPLLDRRRSNTEATTPPVARFDDDSERNRPSVI